MIMELCAHYSDLEKLRDGAIFDLLGDLDFAYKHGTSLADANAIFLSRVVNLRLGLAIPFVSSSLLWSLVPTSHISQALIDWPRLSEAVAQATARLKSVGIEVETDRTTIEAQAFPMWLVCQCGSRVALQVNRFNHLLEANGVCQHCKNPVTLRLRPENEEEVAAVRHRFIPRIILHNYFNVNGFGYRAGVSHAGSADHVVLHGLAISRLGRAVLPQFLWEPRGNFQTPIEHLAQVGAPTKALPGIDLAASCIKDCTASCIYYLSLCDPLQLRRRLEYHLSNKAAQAPFNYQGAE